MVIYSRDFISTLNSSYFMVFLCILPKELLSLFRRWSMTSVPYIATYERCGHVLSNLCKAQFLRCKMKMIPFSEDCGGSQ